MSPAWRLRLRKRTDPTVESPAPAPAAAAQVLQVLAFARTGLPDEEFSAQTAALRSLLEFDGGTRTWHARLSLDQPDRAVTVLNGLLAAAREHGTEVQVRLQPADVLPPAAG